MKALSGILLEQFAPTAEEEAKKINDQTGVGLVTDQSFWERQGIRTGEELAKSVLSQTYSDYYKEVNGFRPRSWPAGGIEQMSVDDIQALIDDLDEQATDEWYEERHVMDQEAWNDDMIDAVQNNPEDVPEEWLEYNNAPQSQGMGRRPSGSKSQRRMEVKKITPNQLRKMIAEGYNSMSDAGKALANRAKRQFSKDYPDVQVGIDGREGWITVDGKKAVNMSQASGSPMQMEDVIDKMKQAYLGHPMKESKRIKITKRQLIKLVNEAVAGNPPAGIDLATIDGSPGSPSESDVSNAWPEGVMWNGHNVYEMFYKSGVLDEAWGYLQRDGYGDGQEAYLGYDPDSDVFVMGFDAFLDEDEDSMYDDDYGGGGFGSSGDSVMDGVIVELWADDTGSARVGDGTVITEPGGMYPAGLKAVKKTFPKIINVRLD